jgi:murein DD-endopeptidase MepM/ murein hydrolase activator NlpD
VNAPVSSEFGFRFDPVMQRYQLHAGIDFAANCGTPVHAAADGDVIMATPESQSGGYGNRLVIDHGFLRGVDLTTTYNHLTSFVVTGGHVARGQVVAYSGTTGFSTGCHLHFETRQDGTPVNPRNWL